MRSLAVKITLACLVASLSGILLVAAFSLQTTSREFDKFVFDERRPSLEMYLSDYYREHGSWESLQLNWPPPQPTPRPDQRFVGGGLTLVDSDGRVVVAGQGFQVGQPLTEAEVAKGVPIEVDGQVVGTLIPVPEAPGFGGPAGAAFLNRINSALLLGGLGAAVIALVVGGLLARALTRPVKQLTEATQAIAQGQLDQRVEARSSDEIGELAQAFNRMSADLARVSELRRQMTADIAHELRTPLSLILAHAEALRDGVIPPTPEAMTLIHDEAIRLSRLVEDLRTLSLADAGELALNRRLTAPDRLLEGVVAKQAIRAQMKSVALRAEVEPGLPQVEVDPDRMAQVLGNLLDNALRYTPSGGSVVGRVAGSASRPGAPVVFSISDTGPGIAAEDLPNIFERFYRADGSRQRDGSGSGLGLAIAKSLVEAHGGRIWAESQPGAGTRFCVALQPAAGPGA